MARRIKQRAFYGSLSHKGATGGVYQLYNAALTKIGAQSFTVSTWVKASSASLAIGSTHSLFACLLSTVLVSQVNRQCLVYIAGVLRHNDAAAFVGKADSWLHLVVVCNNTANTISTYVDGVLSLTTSAVPAWNLTGNYDYEVGAAGTFAGMDVGSQQSRTRFWMGSAFTAEQVAALHYDNVEPSQAFVDMRWEEAMGTGTTMVNYGTAGGVFTLAAGTFTTYGSIDTPPCQIRNALQNLLPQSNVFTNAAWTTFSLTATVSPLAHPTRPGANVYRLTEPVSAATAHLIRQLPVTTTLSGRLVHWTVKVRGGGGRAFAGIFANGGAWGVYVQLSNGAITSAPNALSYSVIDLGNSWYQVDVVAVSDGTQAAVYLASASGVVTYAGDGSYIDVCDAQYRVLDTAADYVDTTTYGVLAGGQGTPPAQNLPLYSQDFSVASWSKTQLDAPVLVSANGGPGGLPIWRLTDTVAAGTHVMAQNVAADTRQPSLLRTITVVAKNETRGWIAVTYDAANQGAYFDLANGAVGTKFFQSDSGATASIQSLGDGWYSCSITCNAAVASNTTASVYLASADGVVTYAGNGSSVLIGSVSVTNTNGRAEYALTTLSAVNTGAPRYQAPQQNLIRFSNDMTQVAAFALTNLTSIVALGNVGPGGMPAFRMTDNVGAGGHYATQTISPVPTIGRAYTLSAIVRAGTKTAIVLAPEGAGFQVTYDLTAGTATTGIGSPIGTAITALGDGWYRCSLTFVSAGASGYRFYISPTSYVADGTGTMDWCGLQLTEAAGVANYLATGTATVSEGAPRGQTPLENLALNSEAFDSWTKLNLTVSSDAATAPDGTMTADILVEDLALTNKQVQLALTGAASVGSWNLSVYIKAVGRTWAALGTGAGASLAYVNLSTGAKGTQSGSQFSNVLVEPAGDGWYRVSGQSTSAFIQVFPANADGGISYTGDGRQAIAVWGAQGTEANGPSAYAKTTTTIVRQGVPRGQSQS